ncbi:MAG: transposase [Clostridia bacterium]|nr:transposase [Clostridia bacterium]
MSWKETDVMKEKEKFIDAVIKAEKPFKYICEDFGISEKTGHKWKNRFYEEGKLGLYEKSREAENHPNALPEDTVIAIIQLKTAHPYWGAKKILELFKKSRRNAEVPSLSSVNRILSKANLIKKRRVKPVSTDCRRLHAHIQPQKVNDVWAIDFKGYWRSDGEICEPFTVRELVSRKILCVKLMQSKSSEAVRAVMTELFKKYGLPKVIRSDNGTPFSSPNGVLSLTSLSAWWITLGITPDRTEKGSPGQNGSLERMHADIAREIEGKVRGGVLANQAVIDAWVEEYNSVRPNEAIGMKTPDEVFIPSERKYIGDYEEIEYPLGFLTRKVTAGGEIVLNSIRIAIGHSLRGLYIGLKPLENNSYEAYLADFILGTVDMNSCCFFPLDVLK